ncbi:MAG: alpha/beta fold hydrolase [Chitinophagales bacterium]
MATFVIGFRMFTQSIDTHIMIQEENGFKYIEEGEGEPLILLHGLFGALSNFHEVIDYFRGQFKVVFPFLPLYDLSLRKSTVSGMVEYLSNLIDHKKYNNFHLLGNSLGGHIAQVYALDNIEKVKSITLTGSSGLFENSLGAGYPNKENYEYVKEKTAYTFYNPDTATKELVDEVYETVNNRSKAIRIITMAKSALRHNLRNELQKLTMPVKLIWGQNDTITPYFVGEEFEKLLPNANLSGIDKCGHAAMMEKPLEFNAILEQFLTSLKK